MEPIVTQNRRGQTGGGVRGCAQPHQKAEASGKLQAADPTGRGPGNTARGNGAFGAMLAIEARIEYIVQGGATGIGQAPGEEYHDPAEVGHHLSASPGEKECRQHVAPDGGEVAGSGEIEPKTKYWGRGSGWGHARLRSRSESRVHSYSRTS